MIESLLVITHFVTNQFVYSYHVSSVDVRSCMFWTSASQCQQRPFVSIKSQHEVKLIIYATCFISKQNLVSTGTLKQNTIAISSLHKALFFLVIIPFQKLFITTDVGLRFKHSELKTISNRDEDIELRVNTLEPELILQLESVVLVRTRQVIVF